MTQHALNLYHVDLNQVQKSKVWFNEQIKKMSKPLVTPQAMLKIKDKTRLVGTLTPNSLYSFLYLPKHKDTLPYYDMFPLIFPISKDAESFTGLNMHYLDYPLRFILFRELMKASKITNINENTKMRLQWGTLQQFSRAAPAQACIKKYLINHLHSQFIKFHPDDWTTAMMLPTHNFKKAAAADIWRESALHKRW